MRDLVDEDFLINLPKDKFEVFANMDDIFNFEIKDNTQISGRTLFRLFHCADSHEDLCNNSKMLRLKALNEF